MLLKSLLLKTSIIALSIVLLGTTASQAMESELKNTDEKISPRTPRSQLRNNQILPFSLGFEPYYVKLGIPAKRVDIEPVVSTDTKETLAAHNPRSHNMSSNIYFGAPLGIDANGNIYSIVRLEEKPLNIGMEYQYTFYKKTLPFFSLNKTF